MPKILACLFEYRQQPSFPRFNLPAADPQMDQKSIDFSR